MGGTGGSARLPLVSAMALALLAVSLLSAGVSGLPQPLPRVILSFEGRMERSTSGCKRVYPDVPRR